MTIGPDPRMRILWRSSRLGTAAASRRAQRTGSARASRSGRDRFQEAIELVERVVGPRAGLRVVLDRRALDLEELEALDRAVVEVDVGERGLPEVRAPADGL